MSHNASVNQTPSDPEVWSGKSHFSPLRTSCVSDRLYTPHRLPERGKGLSEVFWFLSSFLGFILFTKCLWCHDAWLCQSCRVVLNEDMVVRMRAIFDNRVSTFWQSSASVAISAVVGSRRPVPPCRRSLCVSVFGSRVSVCSAVVGSQCQCVLCCQVALPASPSRCALPNEATAWSPASVSSASGATS